MVVQYKAGVRTGIRFFFIPYIDLKSQIVTKALYLSGGAAGGFRFINFSIGSFFPYGCDQSTGSGEIGDAITRTYAVLRVSFHRGPFCYCSASFYFIYVVHDGLILGFLRFARKRFHSVLSFLFHGRRIGFETCRMQDGRLYSAP